MKKILTLLATIFMAVASYAEYNLTVLVGYLFNEDGSVTTEQLNYALVAETDKSLNFSDFKLSVGDILQKGSYVNDTENYISIFTGTLTDDIYDGEDCTFINMSTKIDNTLFDLSGGEEIALVVWNSDGDTMSGGEKYLVFNPNMYTGDNSGANDWVARDDNYSPTTFNAITAEFDGGNIPNSALTLSQTVIPEPSTYAVIFGAIALGFVAYRRRK